MSTPASHVEDGLKLQADGHVVFYEIMLANVPNGATAVLRFRDGPMGSTTSWSSKTWDHMSCKFSGLSKSADGERSRPTLRLINPLGIFNEAAFKQRFDGAILRRYTVLLGHVEGNVPVSEDEIWFIGRVKDLISGQSISFELRSISDGPDQMVPARMFSPEQGFPFVTM